MHFIVLIEIEDSTIPLELNEAFMADLTRNVSPVNWYDDDRIPVLKTKK